MYENLSTQNLKELELYIFNNFRNNENKLKIEENIKVLEKLIRDGVCLAMIRANLKIVTLRFTSFDFTTLSIGIITIFVTISGDFFSALYNGNEALKQFVILIMWLLSAINIA